MRVVPFIGGLHYGAGAQPIIESKSPASYLRHAEPARSATEMIPAKNQFEIPDKISTHFGWAIRDLRVTAIAFARERKWSKSESAIRVIHSLIDMAPRVLGVQINATFQQIGIARDIQINRLQKRMDISERRTLSARLRGFEAVTDFHSGKGKKTNPAAESLVVIVITEVVEFEGASPAATKDIK